MKQAHIALIVFPENQEIFAVPWLLEPREWTHSGFSSEENTLKNHYYKQQETYNERLKSAIKCDQSVALEVLNKQYPDRKVFPYIRAHYNVTNVTFGELLGRPKRVFSEGETLTCVYALPLPNNEIGPNLKLEKKYQLHKIITDTQGNQHFDVGLKSYFGYIRSYETGEELPHGDRIHWCHPSRFM